MVNKTIENRVTALRNSDATYKDATTKAKILEIIKLGNDAEQTITYFNKTYSRGDVLWNIKLMFDALTETTTTKTEVKEETEKIEEVKHNFTEENRHKLIPASDEKYISRRVAGTTDVALMQSAYESRQNILIVGDTGSGKTMLLRHLAQKLQKPYMRVNLNGATTPEDLVGQFIPNTDAKINAKYVWKDGVLTDFMRNGGIFVVDEINMCPADILSILHSVTDDERKIVLTQKDGEVVNAHEDFWIVSTMNPDYEGTKPLNIALKDRFRTVILSYNPAVEKKLGVDEKFLEIVEKLRKSDQISTPVSTRDIIKYRDDLKIHNETVAQYFFINNFEDIEQPVVSEIVELTMNPASFVDSDDDSDDDSDNNSSDNN